MLARTVLNLGHGMKAGPRTSRKRLTFKVIFLIRRLERSVSTWSNVLKQATIGFAALVFGAAANSAVITCGGPSGIRVVTVDPGLAGGVCYTQTGNLQNADYANVILGGVAEVDKDTTGDFPSGDNSEGALQFTRTTSSSGNWSFAESLWDSWSRLFIGFHFGNGGGDPDSFVIELAARDDFGTYALGPTSQLNGLSNIYLLGVRCTTGNNCNPPEECAPGTPNCGPSVPEPGSLTLLGLGALAAGLFRRRRSECVIRS